MSKMEGSTPRITSSLLSKYRGQIVRCIGRVLNTTRTAATLETCDRGQVTVILGPDNPTLISRSNVEVVGRVTDELTIKEFVTYDINDNFDFDFYNSLVKMSQNYPNLFS
ncbi:replication factor A protein 3 [Glomus cerebriforme]|uniref:Replication factor A protein 3 n=1 Tax=Glomus cerebriforme TaxID=658196 RepID=A0A397S890_9GLOM|nr:replication factor A protein 3 [Glomus cerebriforme]